MGIYSDYLSQRLSFEDLTRLRKGQLASISQLRDGRDILVMAADVDQQGAPISIAFASTIVLVMTEFGRTVRENSIGGTDHGHGMLVLGGGLREGVHGDWKGLDQKSLYEGRDLPVRTDFRDLFATVLREHLDFRCPKDLFPGHRPRLLKLFH